MDIVDHTEAGHHAISAFVMSEDITTFGGLGTDQQTEVELGSISKMFTIELLNQQVENGSLTMETELGTLLDLGSSEASRITLGQLADHTSGLPRSPKTSSASLLRYLFGNANPYVGVTEDSLLESARTAKLKNQGEESYSNFGYMLLGLALAEHTHTSYEQLLTKSILEPAGMTNTYLMKAGNVSPTAPRGLGPNGRPAAPWDTEVFGPAGGIRSTAEDMSKFARWMMDRGSFNHGWQKEAHYFWHNGGTGGYSTMLVIDPHSRTAAYASNDTPVGVERLVETIWNKETQ